jgi:PAS domain S-box-containing protein
MTAIPYEAVLGLAAVLAVALALALYRISRLTRCVADNPDSSAGAFATPDGEQRPADAGPDFDGWFLPACIFTADGRARTVNRAFLEWHGGTQAGGLPEKSPAIARLRLAASREGMRERDGGGPAATGAPLELTAADGRRGSFHAYFSARDPARNERCCVLVPAWGGEGKGGLADIFEEAPFGVVLVDRTGRIKAANQTLSWLFGAAAGSPIGADLTGFARETDRAALASLIERAASGDGGEMEIELRPDTPDRKFVSAVVHPAPEEARRRDAGEVVIYLIDNSSRRELEERMIQSQKMQAVGQLAGGIAHDFNNLLTAMSGFCDLLLARHGPGDPSFADIMQISQNANRAANLVRQLLAFSRRQRLVARVIDVTETLADLSHLLRRLIGSDIDLRITHGRGLKPVLVDQSQLEQVLVNLVVNARDAISNEGSSRSKPAMSKWIGRFAGGTRPCPSGIMCSSR